MSAMKTLKSMPQSLLGMFTVFLFVPAFSLVFHGSPATLVNNYGWGQSILIWTAYWVLPWSLCAAILVRRFLFLPFYMLQCIALIAHCMVFDNNLPTDLLLMRYALIGCMAYIGMQFANKDFLYPFLTKTRRFWRKARRFDVNVPLEILGDKGQRISANMENCSATGLCIKVTCDRAMKTLRKKRKGDRLVTVIKLGLVEKKITSDIAWFFDYGEHISIGLRVINVDDMVSLVTEITGLKDTTYSPVTTSQSHLLEYDVRQTAFFLWMLFIALSFGMPAFA